MERSKFGFGIAMIWWLGGVLWAQTAFVSEITVQDVPGVQSTYVAGILPSRAWPTTYFDTFIGVRLNDNSSRIIRASFDLQGQLISANWIEPGDIQRVEYLTNDPADSRVLIASKQWVGVYNLNDSSGWVRFWGSTSTLAATAAVGRPSIGPPSSRVIVALRWTGTVWNGWPITVLNPNDGRILRQFYFSLPVFPTLGRGEPHFWTACCTRSSNIIAYDEVSGNFLLVTYATLEGLSSSQKHPLVYAFTAEGDVRWVGAYVVNDDAMPMHGSALHILPLGDGTAMISTATYLLRIDTRTGRLLSAVTLPEFQMPVYWQHVSTRNHGVLIGYVHEQGIFGGVQEADWAGWAGAIPSCYPYTITSMPVIGPNGPNHLWLIGGLNGQNNKAILAILDPDQWAESPFSFYPCIYTYQLPIMPLHAVLWETTTVSTIQFTNPLEYQEWRSAPASLRMERVCSTERCLPSEGDVDRNGCIDDADLLAVLFAFGQTGEGLPEDVNCDGVVDDADLLIVLFNFGMGC